MTKIALAVLLGAAAPALAQMEPGEWQFNSVTSSKAIKQPQVCWTGKGTATVSMKGRAVQAQSRIGGAGGTGKAPKGKQHEQIEIVTKVDGKRVGPCR